MSAQGRVTGKVMRAYCQQKPEALPCRLIEGDLQWISLTLFLALIIWAVVLPALSQAHKAVKSGEMRKLWSISRFWKWFRKKENTLPVGVIAAIPAIAFVDSLIVMLLVWFLVAFSIYLVKNRKPGRGNE